MQDQIHRAMRGAMQVAPQPILGYMEALMSPPNLTAFWPALTYWSCRAVGLSDAATAHLSAALNLARRASRVVDDVQDHDTTGALWREIGPTQAINVGLALVFAAERALGQLTEVGIDPATVTACQSDFAGTIMVMAGGQLLEASLARMDPNQLSPEGYLEVVGYKTAAFCSMGCRLVARLAALSDASLADWTTVGYHIGILHQLFNDLMALQDTEGKQDIGFRWTFPVVHALASTTEPSRTALIDAWSHGDQARVLDLLSESDAWPSLLRLLNEHHHQGTQALERLSGEPAAVQRLQALLDRFVSFTPSPPHD